MKLNNKGMTLVEIIISIALISIVLIFLFSLLVHVNDINDEAEENSTYLINKSLILKNIENDLIGKDNIFISSCSAHDIYSAYPSDKTSDGGYFKDNNDKVEECIKFDYADKGSAYLGIYYYKPKGEYVISYIHDNVKATRVLPHFADYNVENGNIKNNFDIKYKNSDSNSECNLTGSSKCSKIDATEDKIFHKITIPIIGDDEKDYSIIISYYGIVSIEV